MKIKREVFNYIIFSCEESPVESGGIIGGTENIITKAILDKGKEEYGKYTPNTEFINAKINSWNKNNIAFYGMYHSHFPIQKSLSDSDIEYIESIMVSLFGVYNTLYFPIVIPHKEIIMYRVTFDGEEIKHSIDELIIVD